MEHRARPWEWWRVALALAALGLTACAGSGSEMVNADAKPLAFPCVGAKRVLAQVTPEAELVAVACFYKDYKAQNSLHVDVTVKNVSAVPQRYRVNIFLDNGKAVGGLIPRKGKPPVLQPGAEASFTYPFQGMADVADEAVILVKTVSQ